MEFNLCCDAKAVLGEGPFWHPEHRRLYWLDIDGRELHRFDPETRSDEVFPLRNRVGCIVPVEREGTTAQRNSSSFFLIAAEDGVFEIELPPPHFVSSFSATSFYATFVPREILSETFIADPENAIATNRYNDGKCSPEGRFWFGSLSMTKQPEAAALYVLDKGNAHKKIEFATNSNGLGWSPDSRTFYWVDTPTLKVFAFDYDSQNGEISHRRVAITVPEGRNEHTGKPWGRPDGMTLDVEGMIWLAHWLGGAISRWNPVTGELLGAFPLPVSRVTSLCFGGEELDALFITTARAPQQDGEPESGDLFTCTPGVQGLAVNFFRSTSF